jgi:hypothetical protein
MLNALPRRSPSGSRRRVNTECNLFNARPIGSALFNPLSFVVRRQSPSHGLTTEVDRLRDATR